MKKIFFIVLSFIAVNTIAQDSLNVEGQIIEEIPLNLASGYDSSITKSEADSAYMNNDFATAIEMYGKLLMEGEAAEIYYNLGNSYYKSGDIARAILNYERALLLKPGNDDIKFNLEIARSKTVDKVEEVPDIFFIGWIKSLINSTSVDVWAKWGIAFFILFLVGLYFLFFSNKALFKKIGFIAAIAFLFFSICTNGFAFYQKGILTNRNTAIVVSPSVTVRSTPNDNGTSLFILHEGRKVIVKDNSMKNWKEISLEDGKVGWISASDIEII
ncbi:tetratricopeptide repeat protein [Bacteroides sp. 519]|uniref:tetratricopeptide repeat protein n=1 Tax=Bacteroides sp. 519 TaxID=2302937 RepID=UPI0013D706E6|nr:tetratricopeptide repeat protein [Bacteroides sp. 519]NDV59972.1 tetratricopeptide repeat protein [Bacteroides sp. 519]